jgi:hypothetical protein
VTWHTFFDLSTMQSRHLLAAYAFVLIVQIGYFARIVWQWRHTKAPRNN